MLTLYYYPGACSLAPHIVLEESGARYETQLVDLKGGAQRTPEYLKVNPLGRVPALRTERGLLTENPAILAYLARRFPEAQLADLADAYAFAEMQSFHMFLATTVHVAFAHAFRPARYAAGEAAAAAMKVRAVEMLDEAFAMIEERLADGRPYVHGERYTLSDPYLLVFTRWLSRGVAVRTERLPRVNAHRERIEARPAVQRVLEAERLAAPS